MSITLPAVPYYQKGKLKCLHVKSKNISLVSDGSHTFDDLYEHRALLFIALIACLKNGGVHCDWKSKFHSDGTMFEGFFIVGIFTKPGEQITYHLPMKDWDKCRFITEVSKAPEFDGHTPEDVLSRIALFTGMMITDL